VSARPSTTRTLVGLAWPAVLSYLLNNSYRINDQFWIQGLGPVPQTAVGATFFVQVFNFAAIFLSVGGTLALVARATGARDAESRDSLTRHALLLALGLGLLLMAVVLPNLPTLAGWLGLRGEAAEAAVEYLGTLYLFLPSLAVFPALDAVFIGRGNTRVPTLLQLSAVALNWFLNPLLIYGARAAEVSRAPGVEVVSWLAETLGIEGSGLAGAALATGIARTTSVLLGLLILKLWFGVRLVGRGRPVLARFAAIVRIGAPASASIAVYSLAYWVILGTVLVRFGEATTAALGIGFQVFEGVAFPCYLGVAIAGSSLVGRAIGAREPEEAWRVVHSARAVSRVTGLTFAGLFWFGGELLVPLFTRDAAVERATIEYVHILALSQYWVAVETVNEKVLLGSGFTRPILWIAPMGNLLRIPVAALFAVVLGFGSAGVWWAINVTTGLKAFLFWRRVERGDWLPSTVEPPPGDAGTG